MAIVTYNDNGTIKVVKFGTYVVSTDADPIGQKEWVFLNGINTNPGVGIYQHEQVGIPESDYTNQGCASPSQLVISLEERYPASGFAIGTQAAIRMNSIGGGSTCSTWALFEVQEV